MSHIATHNKRPALVFQMVQERQVEDNPEALGNQAEVEVEVEAEVVRYGS